MYPQTYLIIILRSLIEFGQIGAEVQSDRSFIFIGLLDTPQIVHQSLEYKLQIWKPMWSSVINLHETTIRSI